MNELQRKIKALSEDGTDGKRTDSGIVKHICIYHSCMKWFDDDYKAMHHFFDTGHSVHELDQYGYDYGVKHED